MSQKPTPKPVTRIDLEAIGNGITRVSYWREGWREGDPCESSELVQKAIMYLLMEYEDKQGYTCEMCDRDHGRALRGKTTRVDFQLLPDGWHYRKFPAGWTAKTKPISDVVKTEAQVEEIIAWCEENRWSVRRWQGGARAFLGEPKPVRDASAIRDMRRRAERDLQAGVNLGTNKVFYDFAFDY